MTEADRRAAAPAGAGRDRRTEWILDAAGELLVSRGYRRVTIEEVARRAGVGKGTVYLHFPGKELLFLTVLMRAQSRMIDRLVRQAGDDPSAVLLSSVARSAYLWVHEEPIVRAVLIGDVETLGTLSRSAARDTGDLLTVRERTVDAHFSALREHGLVRDDQPLELQRHAYEAILTGYLMIEPMTPGAAPDVRAAAGMLAHVVRSAFEIPGDPGAARAAAPRVAAAYRRLLDRLHEEMRRRTLI
ncbi:TetR/AcrR family transcriptional regulator [Microbispora sp. ATCC PTA-5024]|uniref:TetR/AcrR family transcriptional regulator n=1 Tax=Microbispora sp. ATCC PTA-5024 TaxID=316330 RepID=UPI0003DC5165|nr:TetR/AcrR family transcriptional regulator [Microbispora sp. ATCC PTA-5024]ETK36637.1 TetR family transcriptional regulator [Microbispora sp. ATCC PTA-5024]